MTCEIEFKDHVHLLFIQSSAVMHKNPFGPNVTPLFFLSARGIEKVTALKRENIKANGRNSQYFLRWYFTLFKSLWCNFIKINEG